MKKTLIIILILFAWVQFSYGAAGDVASVNGKAITAVASVAGKANADILTISGKPCSDGDATCNTSTESQTGSTTSTTQLGNGSTSYALATTFTATSNATICGAVLRMYKVGSPTHDMKACIYDNTGTATNTAWAQSTAYQSYHLRRPISANGYYYKPSAACTSGGSEPEWPTTIGATVADNDCTWTNQGYNAMPGSLIGTCSGNVDSTGLGTSEGDVTFSGMSAAITNTTVYFLVVTKGATSGYTDSSNYVRWANTTQTGQYTVVGTGAAFTFASNNLQRKFVLYK